MTAEALAAEMLAFIRAKGDVTFAELARQWPEHFRRGKMIKRTIAWHGLSETGAAALDAISRTDGIESEARTTLVYVIEDGELHQPHFQEAPVAFRLRQQ